MLDNFFKLLPLMAILRGVQPNEVLPIAEVLVERGFLAIEVPVNSPFPYKSIAALVNKYGTDLVIGAGTVMSSEQVDLVASCGAKLIVMPHSDASLIKYTVAKKLYCIPGCSTITEAIAAIDAGAHALKVFPANMVTPQILQAWRAVLPPHIPLLPVGGVGVDNMCEFINAGANGFGLGSSLYGAGDSVAKVNDSAAKFIAKWKSLI